MNQIRWLRVLSVAVVAAGCRQTVAPDLRSLPGDVSELVSQLPKLRTASTVFEFPEHGFLLFTASYGEPQDCPSGCFYSTAWGIKYAGRIGWIYGAPTMSSFYDVRTSDSFLFDETLWDRMEKEWVGAEFRIVLASDSDTPITALERLATRLPEDGWPFLADLLVDVAQRRDARHVAEIISTLGSSTYNYSYSREHAANALATWPSQPTGRYCPPS